METKELVQHAIDKKYTDFDSATKAILSAKVATKLADSGYFDRLNQAKGISESKIGDEESENFKKTLKKYGADDITDLSDEEKKKFFKEIKDFDSKEK